MLIYGDGIVIYGDGMVIYRDFMVSSHGMIYWDLSWELPSGNFLQSELERTSQSFSLVNQLLVNGPVSIANWL